jgi:hypothetical protein
MNQLTGSSFIVHHFRPELPEAEVGGVAEARNPSPSCCI